MTTSAKSHIDSKIRILFTRLRDLEKGHPDHNRIRNRLIEMHLPLAKHLAYRFRNRGESTDDLIQVANLGLVKSVDRYDVATDNQFVTFAMPTIMGELKRHFRDKSWSMRVPRRCQELRLEINKATSELTQRLGRSPSVEDLAKVLKKSHEEILEGLEANNAYSTVSWNAHVSNEAEGGELGDLVGELDHKLDQVEDRETVRLLLGQLPRRERHIIGLRFFRDLTQSEIGREVGLSQMQVSRVLTRSLTWLRTRLSGPEAHRASHEAKEVQSASAVVASHARSSTLV